MTWRPRQSDRSDHGLRSGLVRLHAFALLAIASIACAGVSEAQLLKDTHPAEDLGTAIHDRRGESIPMDLVFTNAEGRQVGIADYFDGKRPVVLILGYYDCPLLCTRVFQGAFEAFDALDFTLGEDYQAVAVSIDPTNTPAQAGMKQAGHLARYGRGVEPSDWAFLISDSKNVKRLADAVGFEYRYMPKSDEFSHGSAIFILTPDGEVSNIIKGVEYPPKHLRLALMEAADGKMGSLLDRIILYCHIVQPDGKYTLAAFRVMQISGGLTVLALGLFIGGLFLRGRNKPTKSDHDESAPSLRSTPRTASA